MLYLDSFYKYYFFIFRQQRPQHHYPKCHTVYETVYVNQCETTYVEQCETVYNTQYQTEYDQVCNTGKCHITNQRN